MLMLSACAKPHPRPAMPARSSSRADGLFNNWRKAAIAAEREYGVCRSDPDGDNLYGIELRHNAKRRANGISLHPRQAPLDRITVIRRLSTAPGTLPARKPAAGAPAARLRRRHPLHRLVSPARARRRSTFLERPLQALPRLSLRPHRLHSRRLQTSDRKPCGGAKRFTRLPTLTPSSCSSARFEGAFCGSLRRVRWDTPLCHFVTSPHTGGECRCAFGTLRNGCLSGRSSLD